jgi:hypothetical protein
MYHVMKTIARHASASLLETLHFTGLSGEQALLATIVSENPSTDSRVRKRARSLLLLDEGATALEVRRSTAISRRSLTELVQRLRTSGLCAALLGLHASAASRAWLTLSPSSALRVQFQPASSATKRTADATPPAPPLLAGAQPPLHAQPAQVAGAGRCPPRPAHASCTPA